MITPDFGTTNYAVDYQDENGNHVAEKPIQIIRQRAADINNDGKSDLLDLSILANYWGKSNPDEPLADLNSDGTVDILDLSVLAGNWSG